MRKDRNTKLAPPVVGGSSLLVIFSVLCLVMFSILMLQTSQNNLRLAKKSEESVIAYYNADCQAEEILAQIRGGNLPQGVTMVKKGTGEYYSYSCPVSETQSLIVEIYMDGKNYEILSWKPGTVQKGDVMLDLWEGDPVTDLGI